MHWKGIILNITLIKMIIGVALVSIVLTFAYTWHTNKVNTAVKQATDSIKLELTQKSLKALEHRDSVVLELNQKVKLLDLQTEKQMRAATAKYNSLLADYDSFSRLSKRPEGKPDSSSTYGRTTETTEATTGSNFGRLYREDAIFLADYARTTETLKVGLVACYQQYDLANEQLQRLATEALNKPTIDLNH